MKTLHCRFADGASFLEGVRMSEGLASFRFTPERDIPPEIDVGSLVRAVVELGDRTFRVHARVIKRKPAGETRGVRLELLRDELSRQELLLLAAQGESIPYRRRTHVRHACVIGATLRLDAARCGGEVRDISKGGLCVHVRNGALFGVGAAIKVALQPDDIPATTIPARVVGQIVAGPARGLCCEWSLRSSEQKQQLEALIRAVRE